MLGLKKIENGKILININFKEVYKIVDLNGGIEEYV